MTMTPLALLMHRNIEEISHLASLHEAAQQMRDKSVGSLLVTDEGQKIGIVSDQDFVRKAFAEGLSADTTTIDAIMSQPIIAIDIDQTAKEANDMMAEEGVRHLIITDREKVVGIISMRDLVLCFKNRI
ncbi:hypothetical protein MNBD_NITROSPIRAE01-1308 [hydrothermal vent metagenome]|uniref:CBS domain-containing protein n=1 Tax=hydrothermal vent metagenome TaxID=652676 RepID=A0A3B1D1W0_9ZZZZ